MASCAWRRLNRSVYNVGVGGYGPLQYEILVTNALKMQPQQIVVGMYAGNDLGDVARGIQRRDTWLKSTTNSGMESSITLRLEVRPHIFGKIQGRTAARVCGRTFAQSNLRGGPSTSISSA